MMTFSLPGVALVQDPSTSDTLFVGAGVLTVALPDTVDDFVLDLLVTTPFNQIVGFDTIGVDALSLDGLGPFGSSMSFLFRQTCTLPGQPTAVTDILEVFSPATGLTYRYAFAGDPLPTVTSSEGFFLIDEFGASSVVPAAKATTGWATLQTAPTP